MQFEKKKKQAEKWEEGIGRYVKFAAFPVLVIALIVVIMWMDQPREEAPEDGSPVAEQSLEAGGSGAEDEDNSGEPLETKPRPVVVDAIDISRYSLKQDEIGELTELVRAYCKAKEDADPQALAQVFGIPELSEEEAFQETEKMELVKASVKGYENISCYSIEGPEEDSYVVFPYFEIRYRGADILMPQLTWGYAKKNSDGKYYMTQEVSQEVASYIGRIGEKDDVAALIAQVQAAAQAAIDADEKLKNIYEHGGVSEVIIGGMDS